MLASGKHPHVRGEDQDRRLLFRLQVETPPRAWGRPPKQSYAQRSLRNTPTCVGKTLAEALCLRLSQKHPHVRGEDPDR